MKSPKTKKSFGLACVRFNVELDRMEILMIKKRNSFAFMDFVLGRYNPNNLSQVKELFDNMNNQEKLDIASLNFNKIWYRAFLKAPDDFRTRFTNNDTYLFNRYRKFFHKLIENKNRKILELLSHSVGRDSMWEIPKGKKENGQESELACALREMQEETDINPENFIVLSHIEPMKFVKNVDKFSYINTYYFAVEKPNKHILQENSRKNPIKLTRDYPLDYCNKHQLTEVIAIKWMGLQDLKAETDLDFYNITRRIFKIINKDLQLAKKTKIMSVI